MVKFDFTGDRALHPGITFGPYTFLFNSTKSFVVGNPTIDVANDEVDLNQHGLAVDDQVRFTTTGTLPEGLSGGFFYYVLSISSPNAFKISETSGGPAVNITSAGTGVLSLVKRGIPLDITGWSIWAWVKKKIDDADANKLLDLVPTIENATDGRVQILLTDEDSYGLVKNPEAFWDMVGQDLLGQRHLLVQGEFEISKVVTHPVEV